jgi:uncharacterized protein (DUF2062 family)
MLSTQNVSTSAVELVADSAWKRMIRRVLDWMSPFRVWREVRVGGQSARRDFAAGLGIGVFIACIPVYGLQTVLSLFAARRLKLHPLPVIAGSQLSAPPIAPALMVGSVALGRAILTGKLPHLADWHVGHWPAVSMAAVNSFVASWLIGGAILGVVLAFITYLTAWGAMHLMFRGGGLQPE